MQVNLELVDKERDVQPWIRKFELLDKHNKCVPVCMCSHLHSRCFPLGISPSALFLSHTSTHANPFSLTLTYTCTCTCRGTIDFDETIKDLEIEQQQRILDVQKQLKEAEALEDNLVGNLIFFGKGDKNDDNKAAKERSRQGWGSQILKKMARRCMGRWETRSEAWS